MYNTPDLKWCIHRTRSIFLYLNKESIFITYRRKQIELNWRFLIHFSMPKKLPILCLRIPVPPSKQVILIRSGPTYFSCIADQTRSKYDKPTYTADHHAVPLLNVRHGESEIIHDHFSTCWKLIRLTRTSQSGPDLPPLYFIPTYVLLDQGPFIDDPSIFFQSRG